MDIDRAIDLINRFLFGGDSLNFLVDPLAVFLGVGATETQFIIGAGALLLLGYIFWEERKWACVYFGFSHVWKLFLFLLGFLLFLSVVGHAWNTFIHVPWYLDLAIGAVLGAIAVKLWGAKKYSSNENKNEIMHRMVREPELEPVWEDLINDRDEDAFKKLSVLADDEHLIAQNHLGLMYEGGCGVSRSDKEAEKWYRKAAHRGCREAQYNMVVILTGDVIKYDTKENFEEPEKSERLVEGYMWAYLSRLQKYRWARPAARILKRQLSQDQVKTAEQMAANVMSDRLYNKLNN